MPLHLLCHMSHCPPRRRQSGWHQEGRKSFLRLSGDNVLGTNPSGEKKQGENEERPAMPVCLSHPTYTFMGTPILSMPPLCQAAVSPASSHPYLGVHKTTVLLHNAPRSNAHGHHMGAWVGTGCGVVPHGFSHMSAYTGLKTACHYPGTCGEKEKQGRLWKRGCT